MLGSNMLCWKYVEKDPRCNKQTETESKQEEEEEEEEERRKESES